MEEKVVLRVLKVDLQCYCCYTIVNKVLCKFPLLVKVVCCTLKKIAKKFCCKGVRSNTNIEIKEPEKKNKDKEEDEKKVHKKKDNEIKLDIDTHISTGIKPKVVAQPDQDNLKPPHSISSSLLYEGRPSYQYQSLSTVLPSYVERPIFNNYQKGEDRKGYNVGSLLSSTTKKI